VRLPDGAAEEIRERSGRPPSEIIRVLAMAWLQRARSEASTVETAK
jgi:hypothetical protein